MPPIEVTQENFVATVEKGGIVILDFWAAWCGPCRQFAPIFSAAADRHPDIVFGKVDTEAQQELASAFQISSIPTTMIFRDKVMLFQQPGALPEAALEQIVNDVANLDMAEVHKAIAEHQAAHPEDSDDADLPEPGPQGDGSEAAVLSPPRKLIVEP